MISETIFTSQTTTFRSCVIPAGTEVVPVYAEKIDGIPDDFPQYNIVAVGEPPTDLPVGYRLVGLYTDVFLPDVAFTAPDETGQNETIPQRQ